MTSPGDATTLAAMVGSPSEMPLNISSETIADYAINKFGDAQKGGFFSKLFGSKLVSNIDWSKVSKLPASTIFDGTPNKFLTPVQLATLKADLLSVHNKVVGLDLSHKTVEEVIKVGLEKRILT